VSLQQRLFGWLHCPSMIMLVIAAVLMAAMPVMPEPHLWQKAQMLMNGEALAAIDWLDIVWHCWPLIWIGLRLLTPNAAGVCRI